MTTVVIFLVFALSVAAFVGVAFFMAKFGGNLNSSSFQQIAAQQGWSFRQSAPELATRWTGPPFHSGGEARLVFSGLVEGLPFTAFQYFRRERADDGDRSIVPYAVVTIPLPAALPLLWVTPDNLLSQFTNTLGSRDIAFESADFNAAFRVAADTDQFAFAVIHPRMMEYLLASPYRSWSLRIEGDDLIFSSVGPELADQIAATAGWLAGFVRLIPDHVYDQYAVAPGPQRLAAPAPSQADRYGLDMAPAAPQASVWADPPQSAAFDDAPPSVAYAGSTTGLVPELPRGQAVATGAGAISGVLSVVVSVVIAVGFYSIALPRVSPDSLEWWFIVIIPAVGVLAAISNLARKLLRLVDSGAATARNRRGRTDWVE